jgi:transcriptional regulator with XRE-family HTH domain
MIRAKVGTRIRQIRKAKKISQEALANICELDRTYITSVECGKRNISIINLEKITDALDVSLQEFFSFTNEK